MAHGICEFDLGYICGDTWHAHPAYRRQTTPVTIEQVKEVFNWTIDKKQLGFLNENNLLQLVEAYSLVRHDTGHVLVESVGKKFEAESNLRLAEIVEGVVKAYPDLLIEGCGTLWNNKTAFIQLKAKEFQVKGDKSPSFCREMMVNPLGAGAYRALVHNERVVCANTLRIADAEGKANRSLKKFSHLKGAMDNINVYMEELAEQWLLLEKHIVTLDALAKMPASATLVTDFLKAVYPQDSGMSDIATKHNMEKRQMILDQFNKDQDLSPDSAFSRYGLLQALTYVIDHEQLRKDTIKTNWDNWAGSRMDTKAAGYDFLIRAA